MEVEKENNIQSVLHISELTEIAYQVAKEQYGDQFFSFTNIWSKVWKSAENFSKEKVEDWIGFFYTELLSDPRFVIFNFNKWKLKEFMNQDEVKKFKKTVFSDDAFFEEEYETFMTSEKGKKKEAEVEVAVGIAEIIEEEDEKDDEEPADEIFEEEI